MALDKAAQDILDRMKAGGQTINPAATPEPAPQPEPQPTPEPAAPGSVTIDGVTYSAEQIKQGQAALSKFTETQQDLQSTKQLMQAMISQMQNSNPEAVIQRYIQAQREAPSDELAMPQFEDGDLIDGATFNKTLSAQERRIYNTFLPILQQQANEIQQGKIDGLKKDFTHQIESTIERYAQVNPQLNKNFMRKALRGYLITELSEGAPMDIPGILQHAAQEYVESVKAGTFDPKSLDDQQLKAAAETWAANEAARPKGTNINPDAGKPATQAPKPLRLDDPEGMQQAADRIISAGGGRKY